MYQTGKRYYIQTETHYYVGDLVEVTDTELCITRAAWVADSGRHHTFVAGTTKASEMEAWPPEATVIIGRRWIVAACETDQASETI